MSEDTTCNGWKNYPTWNVKLWLDNDQGTYEYVREIAGRSKDAADLADALQDYVEELLLPDLGASFASDLLGYAMGLVDWYEIAENILSEELPPRREQGFRVHPGC